MASSLAEVKMEASEGDQKGDVLKKELAVRLQKNLAKGDTW